MAAVTLAARLSRQVLGLGRRRRRAWRRARDARAALAALVVCGVISWVSPVLAAGTDPPANASGDTAPSPENVTVRGGSSAAGFVGRASLDDDPREVVDVGELLEGVPGAHVRRQGGEDGLATLSLRGTSSSEATVLLAGVPLSGGGDPAIDLSTLPLWPGARVRVFRSFAPATLGPGSLGGTLALDPPSPHDAQRTLVWLGVGSFGAARMRVGDVRVLGDGPEAPRVAVGLSASRATDDFSFYDPQIGGGQFTRQANAQHAQVQALASYTLPFHLGSTAREGELTVTAMAQARRQHLPGTFYLSTPNQVLASDRELASVQASLADGPGAVYARLWGRREDLRLSDDPVASGGLLAPSIEDDTIVAAGGAVGWRGAPAKSAKLDVSLDASGERFVPGDFQGITAPPGATRAAVGSGIDASYALTTASSVAASARLDGWNDAGATSASRFELRPTAHAGAETTAGPAVLAAHGGLLARPASFLERYGDHGSFVGDPALRTESAVTIDAGARIVGKTHHDGTWRASGDVDLSVFSTWATDLITFVAQGALGREVATNIGRARILGLELGAHGELGPFFGRVAYTLLSSENLSACASSPSSTITTTSGVCARPPLPGRPADDLVSDVGVRLGPVKVRYGIDVTSGEYADSVANVPIPARVLQSSGVSLDVPKVPRLRIAVDARNLFDVRTGMYVGAFGPTTEPIGDAYLYPLPGRSVLATIRYETTR